jgi:hypothetical protein
MKQASALLRRVKTISMRAQRENKTVMRRSEGSEEAREMPFVHFFLDFRGEQLYI